MDSSPEMPGPQHKSPARTAAPDASPLTQLPDDLLAASIVAVLEPKELLALQQCDKRLQRLASTDAQWAALFSQRFGAPSSIHTAARQLAGSWQALYASKVVTDRDAGQWRKPCPYELQAALQMMVARNSTGTDSDSATTSTPPAGKAREWQEEEEDELQLPARAGAAAVASDEGDDADGGNAAAAMMMSEAGSDSGASEGDSGLSRTDSQNSAAANNGSEAQQAQTKLAVVFLLDSSGSVGEEDFETMTDFLNTAADTIAATPDCKVSVVQFSNDTRVEVPLATLDRAAFDAAIRGMVRLNGGTNIAAAVAKAGALFKGDDVAAAPDMKRVLVLLTDGRIDGYQAREAAAMVSRLADEQAHVCLWALGVGRGVDSAELVRIIEGPDSVGEPGSSSKNKGGLGKERYLDLCVRDDAPW